MRYFTIVTLLSIVGVVAQFGDATAKVVRAEVLARTPYGIFKPGEYVRLDMRVFGEISPDEAIPDISKAVRNSRGFVDYSTRVTVIMPGESARGNGTLLVDVPNRGRAISASLFNSPRNVLVPLGSFDHGTGFLQDYGFAVATVAWELGYGVELPTFVESDGKPRYLEYATMAIVRDVANYLSVAKADDMGTSNPLAGKVGRSIALGYSQTGRFLKTFLLRGFNVAEGRRVFSGIHILGAASGHIKLESVPGPNSGAGNIPLFDDPEVRGVAEEPLAIADIVAEVRKRGEVAPYIVFVNTTTDYFSLRASFGRTGGDGSQEKPLPDNIRAYDIAGASHGLSVGKSPCKYPFAILDWHPVMRSTLLALDRWVSKRVPPPASDLMPLIAATQDSMALRAPAHLPNAATLVPALDGDGNAVGGVRLPDMEAPLGTHGGQNPPLSFQCALASSYRAFPKTKGEREAQTDSRAALLERYKDKNEYLNRIRMAVRSLEKRGLILSEDAAVLMHSAAEVVFPK